MLINVSEELEVVWNICYCSVNSVTQVWASLVIYDYTHKRSTTERYKAFMKCQSAGGEGSQDVISSCS